MFNRILIANRGEIACRVIDSCRKMGIETVAVYSDADAQSRHVAMADHAVRLGPAPAVESYLRGALILEAAQTTGAEAIHPGYGFLSENAAFAEACAAAGIVFIGPPAPAIRAMGSKSDAKALMGAAGVPLTPGYHGADQDPAILRKAAQEIGYPVLIKASAGGGGKGMRLVEEDTDFDEALAACRREAAASFGDERVLVERCVTRPRHIEIQVFADQHGNIVHLYERDCSIQRRHQKVIEEAPAPGMTDGLRAAMGAAAVAAAKAVDYCGAGTVEFIVETDETGAAGAFFFMEMNTRLQVEHPVTECITGLDLVEWQIRVAAGEALPKSQDEISAQGHAIEVRLYAEDPDKGFLPSVGHLSRLALPTGRPGIRVDAGVREGDRVSPFYDPMIAKVIAQGQDRGEAIRRLVTALGATEIAGIAGNRDFLIRLLSHPGFRDAQLETGFIAHHEKDVLPALAPAPAEAVAAVAKAYLAKLQQDAAHQAMAQGDPYSPWCEVRAWRVAGCAPVILNIQDGTETRRVTAQARAQDWHFTVDETGVQAADAEVFLGNDRQATVFLPTQIVSMKICDPVAVAVGGAVDLGAMTAPMPGKVTAVFVAEGDPVVAGTDLLVLEAMKMEHTIRAPISGIVRKFPFKTNAQVDEGAVLAVVTPQEEA